MNTIKVCFINFNILFSNSLGKGQVSVACGLQYQRLGNSYWADNRRGRVIKKSAFTYLVLVLCMICLNMPLQKLF